MLVLSRKPNESIVINGNITITLNEIDGNKVRLGIEAPPEVKILRGELAGQQARPDQARAPSYRILIVEDDEVDRLVLRRFLSGAATQEYSVSECGLGQEGLNRCQGEKPDCVLLDFRLPDINGLQFLEALRGDG